VAGVFDRAFAARGLEPIYTTQPDRILAVIKAIKAGKWDESRRAMLLETAWELRHAGADVFLVSCSELSLIADTLPVDLPAVDTIDVLAAAVIAFSRGAPPDEILHRIDSAGIGGPARRPAD
jgi:aspartate racemase